ncbi:MAG: amidohydrolase family protein [Lentisphaerae bacterium]|nr:amidohydrolase family protein [Lentisphaerota bacterium]
MSNLYRFDVHTHVLSPKIAGKVVRQLEMHYHIPPIGTGEYSDLLPRLQRAGIERVCIHSAATAPAQVIPANRWALSLQKLEGVIPFGTLHPDYEAMEGELAFLYDHGIRGIKLHPDFQGFRLDAPELLPLFAAMEGNFTIMVHIGDLLPPQQNASCPFKIAAIKKRFPRLQIIASHFGGYRHWQYVLEAMQGLEIYLDTSSSLFAIPSDLLQQIYRNCPKHLLLFGSDYPLFDAAAEMARLQYRLHLSDRELETIMTNANNLGLS